jgi:hypothetical protein
VVGARSGFRGRIFENYENVRNIKFFNSVWFLAFAESLGTLWIEF